MSNQWKFDYKAMTYERLMLYICSSRISSYNMISFEQKPVEHSDNNTKKDSISWFVYGLVKPVS